MLDLLASLAPFRKCVVASVGAAVAGVGAAMTDGSLTGAEVVAAAGAAIAFGFAAWRVPNEDR